MSERQILELGIRALGAVFFFTALASLIETSSIALLGMDFLYFGFAIVLARLIVAAAIFWYAPAIAHRIAEVDTAEVVQPFAKMVWNRWLIASALVFGVATTLVRAAFNTARGVSYTIAQNTEIIDTVSTFILVVCGGSFLILAASRTILKHADRLIEGTTHGRN